MYERRWEIQFSTEKNKNNDIFTILRSHFFDIKKNVKLLFHTYNDRLIEVFADDNRTKVNSWIIEQCVMCRMKFFDALKKLMQDSFPKIDK